MENVNDPLDDIQDVVHVDEESGTESELSVASSSHQRRKECQLAGPTNQPTTPPINKSIKKRTKKTVASSTAKKLVKKKNTKQMAQPLMANQAETETAGDSGSSSCGLEASVEQVVERFAQGCECRDGESCFANINPESAYRHRLNIAELTRSEHDMYLMGVTMASLSNPEETARRTERKRLHTQYVFQVQFHVRSNFKFQIREAPNPLLGRD